MIAATQVELPSIPVAVWDFAAQNGLTSCLRPILTATRDAFPGGLTALLLEQDAEIMNATFCRNKPGSLDIIGPSRGALSQTRSGPYRIRLALELMCAGDPFVL